MSYLYWFSIILYISYKGVCIIFIDTDKTNCSNCQFYEVYKNTSGSHSTFVYVGVSIYKVNVLGPFIEGLLNKLEVPFKYFNKFID